MHRPATSPPPRDSLATHLQVETPEHVVLEYTLAGVGSRVAAALIDVVVIGIWGLACLVLAAMTASTFGQWGPAIWLAAWSVGSIGYYTLFEAYRGGQTPGKRALGIRVVRDTGHGITFGAALARNLLRTADFLPPPYLTGLLLILFHPRSRRLGDLVAGTVVVHDRPEGDPVRHEAPVGATSALPLLVGPPLEDREWQLLLNFRERAERLEPEVRFRLEDQLAARFAARFPVRPATVAAFLEALVHTEGTRRRGALGPTRGPASTAGRLTDRRLERWEAFEGIAGRAARRGLDSFSAAELPDFAARYREVAADLARLRTYGGDPRTVARVERLVAAGHNALYRDERRPLARVAAVLLRDCPAAVWRSRRAVAIALVALFGPAVAGYALIRERPALAYELLPDVMIERAEAGAERQADGLGYVEVDPAERPFMAVYLINNNVKVAFRCFAGGIFLGVGSLFFLSYNGLHLGTSAGHYANVGLFKYLLTFIVGHGVLELFAIAVAGAAGLLLGLALLAPGDLTRSEALVVRGRTAAQMIGVVVVLLVLAGLIEGLASASGASFAYRVAVSSASAVFLLLYLINGARWASTLDAP
jgi:uncharacterized membrane protein SpoIIM required for sporulation/uncharacterized RDD family membrane protein YckC